MVGELLLGLAAHVGRLGSERVDGAEVVTMLQQFYANSSVNSEMTRIKHILEKDYPNEFAHLNLESFSRPKQLSTDLRKTRDEHLDRKHELLIKIEKPYLLMFD